MTGGFSMVYDEDGHFARRYNNELIDIHRITNESDGRVSPVPARKKLPSTSSSPAANAVRACSKTSTMR